MDNVMLSRMLFGSSMAFHIIFATLTVGVSLMIFFAEVMRTIRKDHDYAILAKRWTKGLAILLGVAIPTGTIVAIMLSLLWPGFMEIVGQVIALPFQIEIFAFFLESLFLAIYVYAADRLSPPMRLVSSFLIALGAVASAVLITSAHAWMNTPRGFEMASDGTISNVNPLAAALSPSFFPSSLHVVSTAYMAGTFVLIAVAAYKLMNPKLTGRERQYHYKGMTLILPIAFLMSIWTASTGHDTTVMLYEELPIKLAAAEGLFETQTNAPLTIFGTPSPEANGVIGGIEIPNMLSWLATYDSSSVIQGLNDFPQEEWPPLFVHTLFNVMVAIGFSLLGVAGIGLLLLFLRRGSTHVFPKWLLVSLVAAGPLAIVGIETGWIFSCTGRQPWTIFQVQTTAEAATTSGNLGMIFFFFVMLYLLLAVLTGFVLYFYFKRNPLKQDISVYESV
ncbi:cytochrome ubiquinol oxidase subunit I [Shouchella shacheensis]|uniref:cytochrome ubiquinol oxidase subunit I n=1 Tax=Shouchella shacheensis TaxID=1649580 RepID=UPI00073FD236|nr:cytochrome ubiquinol oxidase subunit I [Shouchella shacheensis]